MMLSAGTCVEWLRDDLGLLDSAERILRRWPPGAPTPAMSGSCPPSSAWAPRSGTSGPGAPCSASPGAPDRPELVRAVLEGRPPGGRPAGGGRGRQRSRRRRRCGSTAGCRPTRCSWRPWPSRSDDRSRCRRSSRPRRSVRGYLAGLATGTVARRRRRGRRGSPRAVVEPQWTRSAARSAPSAGSRPVGRCRGHHPRTLGALVRLSATHHDEGEVMTTTQPTTASGTGAPAQNVHVELARRLHANLQQVLLGTPAAVTVAVVAALSGGHLLIEDVPASERRCWPAPSPPRWAPNFRGCRAIRTSCPPTSPVCRSTPKKPAPGSSAPVRSSSALCCWTSSTAHHHVRSRRS